MILRPGNESLDPPGTFWSPGCKAIRCIFRPLEAPEGRVGTRFSFILACKLEGILGKKYEKSMKKTRFFKKFENFFYVS